jgi:hypothetical protein
MFCIDRTLNKLQVEGQTFPMNFCDLLEDHAQAIYSKHKNRAYAPVIKDMHLPLQKMHFFILAKKMHPVQGR